MENTPNTDYTNPYQLPEPPPKSWLVESILVTVLCCLPFGIAGIVNASQVESRWFGGDKEGAYRASQEAGKWTKIGFGIGISVIAIYVVVYAVIIGTAIGSGGFKNNF